MFENTYWNNEGKYEELDKVLFKQVPSQGKAEKLHIDLLRNVSNLYHDLYNNGLGNLDVIHFQWEHLHYYASEFSETGEITHQEICEMGNIVDDWMRASASDAYIWDDDEDFYERVPDFGELQNRGFCDMMEKLVSAVIVYAAKKEGLL